MSTPTALLPCRESEEMPRHVDKTINGSGMHTVAPPSLMCDMASNFCPWHRESISVEWNPEARSREPKPWRTGRLTLAWILVDIVQKASQSWKATDRICWTAGTKVQWSCASQSWANKVLTEMPGKRPIVCAGDGDVQWRRLPSGSQPCRQQRVARST